MPRPSSVLQYGAALGSVVLAIVVRWLIDPALGDHLPFVTFFVAVLFTAWYGGLGPSLVAILLGALAADFLFVPTRLSLRIEALQHQVGLGLYFFVGFAAALFSEALQAARRRAEESAREAVQRREWLKVTLTSIGDAVIATDVEGRVTLLNTVAERLTGWSQEDAEHQPLEAVFKIVNQESRQPVANPVDKVLRQGNVVGLANHTVLIARNGAELPIDDSAAPIRDEQGAVLGVVLIFRDVTERRRADEMQRRLAAIVESSDDAIVGKSLDGTITSWNAGAERIYGYTAQESLGKSFSFLVPSDRTEELEESAKRLREGERLDHFETVRQCKDGSLIDVSLSYSPIRGSDGRLVGTAVITRDISERKRAERRRHARLAVTEALAESVSLEEATARFLPAVCEGLGWGVGALWLVDREAGLVRCHDVWNLPTCHAERFVQATRELEFAPGSSLPGRVCSSGEPLWMSNVATDERFVRRHLASEEGLHGGFACPIHGESEVLGLLEFFSHEIREPDLDLLEMMTTIGGQIGQFIERTWAEEAVRQSEERFRELVEQAPFSVQIFSPDGRTVQVNPAWERLWAVRFDQLGPYNILEDSQLKARGIFDFIQQGFAGQTAHIPAIEYDPNQTVPGVSQDGDPRRWLSAVIYPLTDSNGRIREVVLIHQDITDRRRAEMALYESEERFRQLAEHIDDVFWMADFRHSHLLYVSPAYQRVWGQSCERLYEEPRSFLEAIHADDRPRVIAALERQALGEATSDEYRIVRPDSSVRWVLDRAFPIRDADGQVYRIAGIAEDITERKRAEEELRQSERASRFLAEATTLLNALTDYESGLRRVAELAVGFFADWCVVDLGEEDGTLQRLAVAHNDPEKVALAEELCRHSPRPTDAHGPQHVYRTWQPQMLSDIDDSAFSGLAQDENYLRILRSLGVRSFICVPLIARNRVLGVLTFAAGSGREYRSRDLRLAENLAHRVALAVDNAMLYTAVQEALRQKEESLALLDTLQQNAPLGLAFVDREFRYIRINEALASIDGNSAEYHLGRTVEETVPELWPHLEPLYRRVLEQGQPVTGQEVTGTTPATVGQGRHWLVNYYPVRVKDEILGIGIMVADITDRKRLEDELRERAKQLTDADRRKDEFLATLAHELRNPLAPISNALHILGMPEVDTESVQEIRNMMERQVEHLVRLVDDLLDVSRVMRGKIQLQKDCVDVATIVTRALETAEPLISAKEHKLDLSLPAVPLRVDADLVRLSQVVSNLLTNSAKYTEEHGHIWLTAVREDNEAVLRVRDNGIGITAEMLPQVFELFVQADDGSTRSHGGLGIGLTLVKNLVELHGGTIEAHSAGLGRGAEFVIRLPLFVQEDSTPVEQVPGERQNGASSGHRVLVVDDNHDAARSFAMLLRLQGHEVQVVHDGPSALEALESYQPNLAFLDIGMPGMDGYELARRMRATPGMEGVVLAALTGWGQQEDRRRSEEAGFDHHLVKPPAPKEVETIMADLRLR